MRKLSLAVAVILASGASLAASSVATLNVSNGSVLVNQGKQFVTAQPGQILAAGDRVMVMEGGNAIVKYADGCIQTLTSGSLAVIAQQSVCALGVNNVAQISPISAQAAGAKNEENTNNTGIFIIAGLAAAGAAVAISDGDDETISP